jgi:hypothetical protein
MIDPIVGGHAPPGDPRFMLPLGCSSFYCCLFLLWDCRLLEGGLDFLGTTPGAQFHPGNQWVFFFWCSPSALTSMGVSSPPRIQWEAESSGWTSSPPPRQLRGWG